MNTSLTESFCIAVLEAACCGLMVVSTDVGGVPEVLPPNMALLAKPVVEDLVAQLDHAISIVKETDTSEFYNVCTSIYSWQQVAKRTENVYDFVYNQPYANQLSRIKTALCSGLFMGCLAIGYMVFESITLFLCQFFYDEIDIDIVPDFDSKQYQRRIEEVGDHLFRVDDLQRQSLETNFTCEKNLAVKM